MSDELKPCPFCGEKPELPSGDGTQYEIECDGCGQAMASVQICDLMTIEERAADCFTNYRYAEQFVERAKVEAIANWNRRAQPAEAEGVDFGFDDRSVKVSQEAYSIFMERERHHRATLSAVTAERDRLAAENEQLKHVPAQELLERLVAQLKESGAENYQESCFGLQIGSKELEAFVTLRHAGKPGPHQLRMAAEAERDQLRAEVEALRPDALIGTDAYRATVYVLRRAACDEVFGVAKLQRIFLLDWQSAKRLLKEMVRRGDVEQCASHGWKFPDAAMAAKEA